MLLYQVKDYHYVMITTLLKFEDTKYFRLDIFYTKYILTATKFSVLVIKDSIEYKIKIV